MPEAVTTASMKADAKRDHPKPGRYMGPAGNQIGCFIFGNQDKNIAPIHIWRLNGVDCTETVAAKWLADWQGEADPETDRASTLTPVARAALLDEMDRLAGTIPFQELQGSSCPTPRMAVYLTLQWVLDPMRKPDPQTFLAAR